jgi:hypothetical protein
MKKTKFDNLKIVLVGILLVVGMSYVSAWAGPSVSSPDGNPFPPLHTGASPQTKIGSLGIGNMFSAFANASFNQDVTFKGKLYGGTPIAPSTLKVGDKSNNRLVDMNIPAGEVNATGSIKVTSLAGGKGDAGNGKSKLCVDLSNGNVVFCDVPTTTISFRNKTNYPAFDVSDVGIRFTPNEYYSPTSTYYKDYTSAMDITAKLPYTFKVLPYASCKSTSPSCSIKVLFEITDNDLAGTIKPVYSETISATSTTKVLGNAYTYTVPSGHVILLSVTATTN